MTHHEARRKAALIRSILGWSEGREEAALEEVRRVLAGETEASIWRSRQHRHE